MRTFSELKRYIFDHYVEWQSKLGITIKECVTKGVKIDDLVYVIEDFNNQRKKIDELYQKAITDPTTGLYSKTFYDEKLYQLSDHYNLAFLIADADYFKKYNDAYGHTQGDTALWCISQQFKKSLENLALYHEVLSVIRFGGEELCAFIENWQRSNNDLYIIANSVRQDIASMEIERARGENFFDDKYKHSTITIAAGMRNHGEDVHSFVQRVDYHLTRKNSEGRNRVYS